MPRPNNGPRLARNPEGIYVIRTSHAGRSRDRSTGTRDLGLAQKVFAEFLTMLANGDPVERPRDLTVADVMGDVSEGSAFSPCYWHEHVLKNVIGVETQRRAACNILAHFGAMRVKDIKPEDVDRYTARRKAGEIGKGGIGSTVGRELSVLTAAINHSVRARRIPAGDAPFIKRPPHSPPRDRWLTHAECQRLMAAARTFDTERLSRIHRFIAIGLQTASRRTAILELKWRQVDLERGTIRFNPHSRTQTNKRRPPVPISDDLMPILQRAYAERTGDYVLDHSGPIRWEFYLAARAAKLPGISPHVLRHTWATLTAQAGVPLSDIAAVLGDSTRTVEKNYLHHCPDHLRGAINAVRMAA